MKRMRPIAVAILILAVAALAVAPANAQMKPTWELNAFGGGLLAGDLYTLDNGQVTVEDSWIYGGRLGANLNDQFGIEASYAHANSDVGYRGTIPEGGSALSGNVSFDEIDLNGNFGSAFYRQAYGYFTIGLGMTIFTPHVSQIDAGTSTRFASNIGVGGKYFFNQKLGLRIDARYRLTSTDITTDSGAYCDPYWGCYSYYSTWYDTGELTAGLVYKLGSK
jgi:hypothetical protein